MSPSMGPGPFPAAGTPSPLGAATGRVPGRLGARRSSPKWLPLGVSSSANASTTPMARCPIQMFWQIPPERGAPQPAPIGGAIASPCAVISSQREDGAVDQRLFVVDMSWTQATAPGRCPARSGSSRRVRRRRPEMAAGSASSWSPRSLTMDTGTDRDGPAWPTAGRSRLSGRGGRVRSQAALIHRSPSELDGHDSGFLGGVPRLQRLPRRRAPDNASTTKPKPFVG